MKNKIIGALTLLLIASKSFAGYDVLFCTSVDSLGNCKETAEEFKWTGDKMKLHMLVLNKDGLNTTKLIFHVFTMKSNADPDLLAELSMHVTPKLLYAQKDILFFKPGKYKVDVYDVKNSLLSTSFVTITDR